MTQIGPGSTADDVQHLARGMFWLGFASIVSKIIDALSLVVVLVFLSREQLGLATLAWSVTTFIESFNGLGIGAALIQRDTLSEDETGSAHGYALIFALLAILVVCTLAGPLAALYGTPELSLLVQVSSTKLLFVGLAHVPLALLSRSLNFRMLGAIISTATLLSAVLTIFLAAAGSGAWAPLIGNTAHGLFQLIGVLVIAPRWPRMSFAFARLRSMLRVGLNVTGGSALNQVIRNLDYFVVGRIAGLGPLGSYRLAFDLAMAPTVAILQVTSRAALPVYSRLRGNSMELARVLAWTIESTSLWALAPLLLVFFEGQSIIELLGKAAEPHTLSVLRCLCVAAFLRALTQPCPQALLAAGRSGRGLTEAFLTALTLVLSMAFCVRFLVGWPVPLRVACAWLSTCVALLPLEALLTRGIIRGSLPLVARAVRVPFLIVLSVGGGMALVQRASPLEEGATRLAAHGLLLLALYALAIRYLAPMRFLRSFNASGYAGSV